LAGKAAAAAESKTLGSGKASLFSGLTICKKEEET